MSRLESLEQIEETSRRLCAIILTPRNESISPKDLLCPGNIGGAVGQGETRIVAEAPPYTGFSDMIPRGDYVTLLEVFAMSLGDGATGKTSLVIRKEMVAKINRAGYMFCPPVSRPNGELEVLASFSMRYSGVGFRTKSITCTAPDGVQTTWREDIPEQGTLMQAGVFLEKVERLVDVPQARWAQS